MTLSRRLAPLVALVLAAGCAGGEGNEATLHGQVREQPLEVGDVRLPAVGGEDAGRELAFQAADDELLVTLFGYTNCPDVCPATLSNLKIALARLDGEHAARVSTAFVTVDPDRDTPEVLTGYLGSFLDRFHAVRTEDPGELERAEEAFLASSSVTTTADGRIEVSHTGTAYVVDDTGTVLTEWPFGISAEAMAEDLDLLFDRQSTTS